MSEEHSRSAATWLQCRERDQKYQNIPHNAERGIVAGIKTSLTRYVGSNMCVYMCSSCVYGSVSSHQRLRARDCCMDTQHRRSPSLKVKRPFLGHRLLLGSEWQWRRRARQYVPVNGNEGSQNAHTTPPRLSKSLRKLSACPVSRGSRQHTQA